MNTDQNTPNQNRQAALNGLAIVGFVALVGAGMWLAVYSARFVPIAVSRLGAAAVSLTSLFTPAPGPSLSVVTGATTTIPFGNGTSTPVAIATSTTPAKTPSNPTPVTPTAGPEASSTTQLGGTPTTPTLYGLPDFVVNITAVGYLSTTSADSFIVATSVPNGARPAVRFSIKNIGTNVAGAWRFSASIPTQTAYIYQSAPQQSLNPGDHIDYTMGFDQANPGANQTISITANFDHAVTESNTNNNSASATITIVGS